MQVNNRLPKWIAPPDNERPPLLLRIINCTLIDCPHNGYTIITEDKLQGSEGAYLWKCGNEIIN